VLCSDRRAFAAESDGKRFLRPLGSATAFDEVPEECSHLLVELGGLVEMSATAVKSPEHALLELTIMNAQASNSRFEEVAVHLLDRGIPAEVVTRLASIWEATEMIAGEVIAVGRIVVAKIVEFLNENPTIAAGIAIGAAIAALIASLPVLGPLLAPLTTPLALAGGGAIGANMQRGHDSGSIINGAIDLASKFFSLLIQIFQAVAEYWGQRQGRA
jgi:hypothetical protein